MRPGSRHLGLFQPAGTRADLWVAGVNPRIGSHENLDAGLPSVHHAATFDDFVRNVG